MASPFIPIDRNCPIELPASLEGWLREDHLARFVVDVVEQGEISPKAKARAIACWRFETPSLWEAFWTWNMIVRSETPRIFAISQLVLPSPAHSRHSFSRAVRSIRSTGITSLLNTRHAMASCR